MDLLAAYSWPYNTNPEESAQKFFQQLYNGVQSGKPFPFNKPYQVALVRNSYGNLFVGVLVLRETSGDDSVETHALLDRWYEECGYQPKSDDRYTDYESVTIRGGSIQTSLDSYYIFLSSFGSIAGPVGVKPSQTSSTNTKIAAQFEQKPEEPLQEQKPFGTQPELKSSQPQLPISPNASPKKVGIRVWFALVLGGVLTLAGFCLGFILLTAKIVVIEGSPPLSTSSFITGIACFSLAPLIIGLLLIGFGINSLRKRRIVNGFPAQPIP